LKSFENKKVNTLSFLNVVTNRKAISRFKDKDGGAAAHKPIIERMTR